MPKGERLTPKQKVFVGEYVEKKNATEAALKAYETDSRNTARSIGAENLAKPAIKKAVEEALVKLNLTPEWSLSHFKRLAERQEEVNPMASIRAAENIASIQDLYPKSQNSVELGDGHLKVSWEN